MSIVYLSGNWTTTTRPIPDSAVEWRSKVAPARSARRRWARHRRRRACPSPCHRRRGGRDVVHPRTVTSRRQRAPRRGLRQDLEPYAGETNDLFYNGNDDRADGGGTPPAFMRHDTCMITEIVRLPLHGLSARTSGTVALRGAAGTTDGSKPAPARRGRQRGERHRHAKPNVTVPAGKNTIIESDPASFSQNDWSKGIGMTWVYGAEQKSLGHCSAGGRPGRESRRG